MSLAWCMIALSLVGADDQEARKPQRPSVVPRATEVNTGQMQERWPMDLAMATRIAFDNSENFRLVQFGVSSFDGASFFPMDTDGPIRIGRLNADVPVAKFKADAMAFVRSVEQRYWSLAQAQVALESAEQAVRTTRELLEKAQAELTLSLGSPLAEVAEAARRLEQFSADQMTRQADVASAERALHNVLGLPPTDQRLIVATTQPTVELVSFDWDTCVDELLRDQPDNVRQQAIVRLAELSLELARHQLIPLLDMPTLRQLKDVGSTLDASDAVLVSQFLKALGSLSSTQECIDGIDLSGNAYIDSLTWQRGLIYQAPIGIRGLLPNTRQAQYALLRARARQRQVLLQTTQSLSRVFLEVDANYKQYNAARRLRAAATQRLDVQRAGYQEGRITVDRLLNAIYQNDLAITNEARYKTMYNISLAALSEAKGTLLADRNIVAAEGPKDVRSRQNVRENRLTTHISPFPIAALGVPTDPACALAKLAPTSMPVVPPEAPTTADESSSQAIWPMSLAEAIRIAIDNHAFVALSTSDDASASGYKAKVMAHVRSIEQQYWSLAQAHVQLWVAEQCVKASRDIIETEEPEIPGCKFMVDLNAAKLQLENFNRDVVARTSDVINAERQLRAILGLSTSDNRQIIPMTPPIGIYLAFDWDTCLHEMLHKPPALTYQQLGTVAADAQQVAARTTQSLARLFLEVDSNYKQFKTATRLRIAAAQQLEVERGYYEKGRIITVDRFLDAFRQYATAVVTEFQCKTAYNVSLAALSEAKGTLLADRGISVSESARPTDAKSRFTIQAKLDDQTKKASIDQSQNAEAPAKPKTWSFSISIGWDKPLQIKGTISVDEPAVGR